MARKIIKNNRFNESLGRILRTARSEKKLTLDEIGKKAKLNLTRSALSYIELGSQQISAFQLYKICQALNLSCDKVFKEIEDILLEEERYKNLTVQMDDNKIISIGEI